MALLQPNRIASLRRQRDLSQGQLAEKLGVHWVTVSKLERGRTRFTLEWAERLATALEVDISEFFPRDKELIRIHPLGRVENNGEVDLFPEDNLPWATIHSDFLNSPTADWVFVGSNGLYPFFHKEDILRLTWLFDVDKHNKKRLETVIVGVVGRVCLVTVDEDAFMGVIGRGTEPDTIDLHNVGHAPITNIRPLGIAQVTGAIMWGDLDKDVDEDFVPKPGTRYG